MEVSHTEFYEHIRENDAAFSKLDTRITVMEGVLTDIHGDVKTLLKAPAGGDRKANGNKSDLIRLLVGALLALAGVGLQRVLGG